MYQSISALEPCAQVFMHEKKPVSYLSVVKSVTRTGAKQRAKPLGMKIASFQFSGSG